MKKILIVFVSLFLVGCGNKFTCTKTIEEEEYTTEERLVFEYDKNDKITNATVDYIMTFENEEKANYYMKIFGSLENNIEIEQDGKEIRLSSTTDYQEYNGHKDELKNKLEKDGYVCK